jgi:hypothetical protein
MRKLVALASLVAVIAACGLVVGQGVAGAGNGNGAVVNRDPYGDPHNCGITGPNGEFWSFDCTIQQVINPKGDINEYINGDITGGSPPPATAEHVTTAQTGQICDFVNGTVTNNVRATITPGGQVSVTCRD